MSSVLSIGLVCCGSESRLHLHLCIARLSRTRRHCRAGKSINHSICHRISDATWHHSGVSQLSDPMNVALVNAHRVSPAELQPKH